MLELLDNETVSALFDAVLLLSVSGLWILWWRQAQQRKNIEGMLIEASTQLQEATMMLDQALTEIRELQERGEATPKFQEVHDPNFEKVAKIQFAKAQFKEKVGEKVQIEAADRSGSTANISQVAQMLRLQREGMPPEKISERLNVPLAQIKLMLMLQSSPKL